MFNTRSLVKETVVRNYQKGWRACDGVKGGFLCDMVWGADHGGHPHTQHNPCLSIY